MNHIALLGDSIFDNAAYVKGGSEVITHLKNLIPRDWKATLKAVDGSMVSGVLNQIGGLPHDATHLVVSAGGNDAIDHSGLLDEKVESVGQLLNRMADLSDEFEAGY